MTTTQTEDHGVPVHSPWTRVVSLLSYALENLQAQGGGGEDEEIARVKALYAVARARDLAADTEPYAARMSEPAPQWLTDQVQKTALHDWEGARARDEISGTISAVQCAGAYEGLIVAKLAEMCRARRVLEIGMFSGTTTMAMAKAPGVEHVTCLDVEPYFESFNRPAWKAAGVSSKIRTFYGPVQISLPQLSDQGETFDFIFLDADKPGYWQYYDTCISHRLLAYPHGVMAVDNVLFRGHDTAARGLDEGMSDDVRQTERVVKLVAAVADFNRRVREDARTEVMMLGVRDGISLITWKRE